MSKITYKYNEKGMFERVLDAILRFGSFNKACDECDISPMTLSRWRHWSEDGKEEFQEVNYRELIQPFHVHVEDAIMQSVDEIEAITRAAARDGYYRPTINKGQFCYEDDEYAMGLTEKQFKDMLDLGLVWEDRKKRVLDPETGVWTRVKVMEWVLPSLDAQALVLRSWSDRYADKRSLNINGRFDINQNLGVSVIGSTPQPPPKLVEVITPQIAQAVNEEATEAIYDEIEEREPEHTQIEEPEDRRTQAATSPPSSLSAEQVAILDRLKSPNPAVRRLAEQADAVLNRAPKPVAPVRPAPPQAEPSTWRGDDQDDTVQRTPRGFKIV